eukprot:SAG31_NODE_2884_length_4954_cov_2.669619_9_plen_79_part_00
MFDFCSIVLLYRLLKQRPQLAGIIAGANGLPELMTHIQNLQLRSKHALQVSIFLQDRGHLKIHKRYESYPEHFIRRHM